MKISVRRIAALCLSFLILPLFDGCGGSPRQRENRERETYNLERFQTEIRQRVILMKYRMWKKTTFPPSGNG